MKAPAHTAIWASADTNMDSNAIPRTAALPLNGARATARLARGGKNRTKPAAASASSVRLARDNPAAVRIAGHMRSPRSLDL